MMIFRYNTKLHKKMYKIDTRLTVKLSKEVGIQRRWSSSYAAFNLFPMSTWIHWFQITRRSSSAKTSRSAQRVEQAPLDRFVTSLDSSPRQNSSVLAGWKFWHLQMLKIAVAQFMSQKMLECFTCCTLKIIKSSWPGQYLWAKKEKYCGWGKGASTGALPTGRNRCSSFFEVRSHSVWARI